MALVSGIGIYFSTLTLIFDEKKFKHLLEECENVLHLITYLEEILCAE